MAAEPYFHRVQLHVLYLLDFTIHEQFLHKVPFQLLFMLIDEKPDFHKGGFSATFSSMSKDSISPQDK